MNFPHDDEERATLFKLAGKKSPDQASKIDIRGVSCGKGHFLLIAGPCAVESEEQIAGLAVRLKEAGADMLRGGAFKSRTSPYSFQGLGREGLTYLTEAGRRSGLPVISEITHPDQIPLFAHVDVIQVGARNMQNFELLKALGKTDKPILLKRGLAANYGEWLMSAEYIMREGNTNVILCERGIRTFESYTRNTLDLSALPALHQLTHLPVIVDPSHATGRSSFVEPMALAAAAAGADGLMIEVHERPSMARSDGAQALTPDAFSTLAIKIRQVRKVLETVEG